jgi:hypothetical protein
MAEQAATESRKALPWDSFFNVMVHFGAIFLSYKHYKTT